MIAIAVPYKYLPNSGSQSNWFAVNGRLTSLNVSVARIDADADLYDSDGTNLRFRLPINWTGVIAINPGDIIYVVFGPYSKAFTVASVTYPFGSSTLIVTTELYTGATVAGLGYINFLTARPNYYLKFRYRKYDGATFQVFGSGTMHRVNALGVAQVDIAGILSSALSLQDTFLHTVENKKDTNLSARMQLEVAEGWTIAGVVTDQAYQGPFDLNAVNAAMQIQHAGGANMLEFMVEGTGLDKANLLSQIGRSNYWPGLPFDVSFLFDALANDTPNLKRFTELYINNLGVGLKGTLLDATGDNYLNRLTMEKTPLRELGIDKIKVYLGYDGFGAVKRYVDVDYVDDDFIIVI